MYQPFYTPVWLQGFDIIADILSIFVAFLIAVYGLRLYSISKENKFFYFSCAFLLIVVGLLAKVITFSVLYYTPVRDVVAQVVGNAAGEKLQFSTLWYRFGYFTLMSSMLSGFLLLFFVAQKDRPRLHRFYEISQIALFVYLIVLISIVSNFEYVVFYLTSAVILGLTTLHHYTHYLNQHTKLTLWVINAFGLLTCSNLLYSLVIIHPSFYALGTILQVGGFLLLLFAYIQATYKQ